MNDYPKFRMVLVSDTVDEEMIAKVRKQWKDMIESCVEEWREPEFEDGPVSITLEIPSDPIEKITVYGHLEGPREINFKNEKPVEWKPQFGVIDHEGAKILDFPRRSAQMPDNDTLDALRYMSGVTPWTPLNLGLNESKPRNIMIDLPHFCGEMKNPCSEIGPTKWELIDKITGEKVLEGECNSNPFTVDPVKTMKEWLDGVSLNDLEKASVFNAAQHSGSDFDLNMGDDGNVEIEDGDTMDKLNDMSKALEADKFNVSRGTLEQRKKDGLCPQCGEKGAFAPISFAMTCSKHGAY